MFTLITFFLIAALGFMMAYIYKRTQTAPQFLQLDSKKALRVYLWVFGFATAITLALSWFAARALTSSPILEEGKMNYNNFKLMMVFSLNISFFAMVLLANLYSQALKKLAIAPYIFTFCFYALFIFKDAYYISDSYILWQKSIQLMHGEIPDLAKTAWTKCFLGFAVTAFNAVAIWWGLRK